MMESESMTVSIEIFEFALTKLNGVSSVEVQGEVLAALISSLVPFLIKSACTQQSQVEAVIEVITKSILADME